MKTLGFIIYRALHNTLLRNFSKRCMLLIFCSTTLYGAGEWEKAIEPYKKGDAGVVVDFECKDIALKEAISAEVHRIFKSLEDNLAKLPPDMRQITRHDSLAIPMVAVFLLDLQYLLSELSECHLFSFENVLHVQKLISDVIEARCTPLHNLITFSGDSRRKSLCEEFAMRTIHSAETPENNRMWANVYIITGYIMIDVLGIKSFLDHNSTSSLIETFTDGVNLAQYLTLSCIPAMRPRPNLEDINNDPFLLAKWVHNFKWNNYGGLDKPLTLYCQNYSNYKYLVFLILKGVNLNHIYEGETILHHVLRAMSVKSSIPTEKWFLILKTILINKVDPNLTEKWRLTNLTTRAHLSPLHTLAIHGDGFLGFIKDEAYDKTFGRAQQLVQVLIDHQADINFDFHDGSPLDFLVQDGSYRMAALFLSMGAKPTHKTIIEALNRLLNARSDKHSVIPLDMQHNQAKALRLVIQHVVNALIDEEREAIQSGRQEAGRLHSRTLNYLIRNVTDPDTCALMRLTDDDVNRDIAYYIYLLIWLDTHYPLEDNFTDTPVAYKLINYRKVLEEIYFNQRHRLIEFSRDALFKALNLLPSEAKNKDLREAIMRKNLQQVSFWLQLGADPNACDESGTTILLRGVHAGNVAIVQMLIEYGADMMSPYALDLAIIKEQKEMIRCLLQQYVKLRCAEQGIVAFGEIFNELTQEYNIELESGARAINFVKEIFYEEGWLVRPSRILSIQPVPLLQQEAEITAASMSIPTFFCEPKMKNWQLFTVL